jgi:hypothetical protein
VNSPEEAKYVYPDSCFRSCWFQLKKYQVLRLDGKQGKAIDITTK